VTTEDLRAVMRSAVTHGDHRTGFHGVRLRDQLRRIGQIVDSSSQEPPRVG
jgi:hypothetical protein